MSKLYPLKFKPIAREMIWGGTNLKGMFEKPFSDEANIGESWEISSVPGNISVVANGFLKGNNLLEIIEIYMGDLVGEKVFDRFGVDFPLLIKLIDACAPLSVQVHPGDELAFKRHGSNGKTEMWYVLHAEDDATLISGFRERVPPDVFLEKVKSGELREILNEVKVDAGDVFFIPSGQVHAIGKGIVLAEIQQTSDITYRLYDYGRVDENGKSRELHIDLAMEAIDFNISGQGKTSVDRGENVPVTLADCKYFTVNRLLIDKSVKRDYSLIDSFIIYICIEGSVTFKWEGGEVLLKIGETLLVPATLNESEMIPDNRAGVLEVYVKN